MEITWLGVVVAALLLIGGCIGYRRGFIKEILSFFMVFLTLALAWTINPYVNTFVSKNTSLYEHVETSCEKFISDYGTNQEGNDDTDTEYETDYMDEDDSSLIDRLQLPQIIKQSISKNNTADTYEQLAVSTFTGYISGYLSRGIVNGISYLISYIIANLIMGVILYILNIIAKLPLINSANRLTGGALGLAKGILFVWVLFLLVTVMCNTEFGSTTLDLIDHDLLLRILYENDIFVKIFTNVI